MIPNCEKYFLPWTFTLDNSYVVFLTQKNVEGDEFPVAFMSYGLKGVELKYLKVEKQAFVMFKAMKHFQP